MDDTHRTAVLPVVPSEEVTYPSHHKRFVVKMFSFVKPQKSENLVCNEYHPWWSVYPVFLFT